MRIHLTSKNEVYPKLRELNTSISPLTRWVKQRENKKER